MRVSQWRTIIILNGLLYVGVFERNKCIPLACRTMMKLYMLIPINIYNFNSLTSQWRAFISLYTSHEL